MDSRAYRLASLLVGLASLLVARDKREEWAREWRAELWHRSHRMHAPALRLLWVGFGCFRHAGVLRFMRKTAGSGRNPRPALRTIEKRGWTMGGAVEDLTHDVRYAVRSLARARGFAIVVIISLASGVGVITAALTGLDAVWLKPVPGVQGEDAITEIVLGGAGYEANEWSMAEFAAARDAETPIRLLSGWTQGSAEMRTSEGGHRLRMNYVSANFFDVLGVVPSMGRGFVPGEDSGPGQHPVAVISRDTWMNRLGGREDVIGSSINLDRVPYTVVGVASTDFRGHRPNNTVTDVWVPLVQYPDLMEEGAFLDHEAHFVRVLGRMEDRATVEDVTVALRTVFERLWLANPRWEETHVPRAATFGRFPAQGRIGDAVAMGMIVGLLFVLLLIICGNLAGMVLARSASRERELGVRLALGSQRSRILRQLMVEALMLATIGGAIGITASYYGMRALPPAALGIVTPGAVFTPSLPILALSALIALATTLTFGLGPALRFSRPELVGSLKDDSGVGGRRVGRMHRFASASQSGIAIFAVILGGLFWRTLAATEAADLGFVPQDLLVSSVDLSAGDFAERADVFDFAERFRDAVEARPGIVSASLSDGLPRDMSSLIQWVSRSDRADEDAGRVVVETTRAGPHFFETLGIPIAQGRGFSEDDGASEPVAIIGAGLAQRLWPGEEALGQSLRWGREDPVAVRIVGVAAQTAGSRPKESWPHLYLPLAQNPRSYIQLIARGSGAMSSTVAAVRSGLLEVDPGMAVPEMRTASSVVERSNQAERGAARMGLGLGALTVVLAAIGVYGVIALTVASRTREIGVRMALGASRTEVMGSVLSDAVRLVVPGLVVGALLAVGLGFVMRSELFGITPLDPVALMGGGLVLLVVVVFASLVPARRASGINPVEALRAE